MGGADRLSGLSDDLLASILSSLPTREAIRTGALSRRWRPVWLRTDSLILDTTASGTQNHRLLSHARKILGDAGRVDSHVRTLSLSVRGRDREHFEQAMGSSRWRSSRDNHHDLMAYLLAAPALQYLEEVRVEFQVTKRESYHYEEVLNGCVYTLDPAVLPEHTLRVLDLAYCRLESPPDDGAAAAAVTFPHLSSLRLYKCSSSTRDLEGWIRTAPSLRSLHIQDHNFYCLTDKIRGDRFVLDSPSLTVLTLVTTDSWHSSERFEVDAPRLRTFKHKGTCQAFSMKSHTAELLQVDLTVAQIYENRGQPVQVWFAPFWRLLRNFRHVKAIKLKVPNIEGIAVDKDVRHEHLFTLTGLESLELKGFSDPGRRDDAALAIANLLQCCPVIRDLRIRIPTNPYRTHRYVDTRTKAVPVFDVSMDVFRRRFSKEMIAPPMLDRDDYGGSSQVAVLPGLTGCRFRCLEDHLKNVTLQFELKELNSFEVCLAKFFAENCMALEELQIDDGKHNFLSHINWMVERWRANASKQRKQIECDSADSSKQSGKRKRNYRVYNAQ